jgi:hypothetical protein
MPQQAAQMDRNPQPIVAVCGHVPFSGEIQHAEVIGLGP